VSHGQHSGSPWPYSRFSRPEPLLFLASSSSVCAQRLSGPRSRPTIDTIKKNTQTLIEPSKEVGLEVNTEKTKYMLLSRHQYAGQNHDIKLGNRCSKVQIFGNDHNKSKPDSGGN
jgi:hypothetical protein